MCVCVCVCVCARVCVYSRIMKSEIKVDNVNKPSGRIMDKIIYAMLCKS